jgi:hypothetical protein
MALLSHFLCIATHTVSVNGIARLQLVFARAPVPFLSEIQEEIFKSNFCHKDDFRCDSIVSPNADGLPAASSPRIELHYASSCAVCVLEKKAPLSQGLMKNTTSLFPAANRHKSRQTGQTKHRQNGLYELIV